MGMIYGMVPRLAAEPGVDVVITAESGPGKRKCPDDIQTVLPLNRPSLFIHYHRKSLKYRLPSEPTDRNKNGKRYQDERQDMLFVPYLPEVKANEKDHAETYAQDAASGSAEKDGNANHDDRPAKKDEAIGLVSAE